MSFLETRGSPGGGTAGLAALSSVIHPCPTQAKAIRRAADAYRRTRLTPTVKKVFDFLMKSRCGN